MYNLVAGLCSRSLLSQWYPLSVSQSNQAKPKYPKSATTSVPAGNSSSRANDLLVLMWVRLKHDGPPLLASQVEHACQLAREQTAVTLRDVSHSEQPCSTWCPVYSRHAHDLLGEGRQPIRDHPLHSFCQHAADLLEEPLQWLGSRGMEPLVDRLVCNRKSGEEPESAFRDETPHGQLHFQSLSRHRPAVQPTEPLRAGYAACQGPRTCRLAHVLQTLLEKLLYVPDECLCRRRSW